MSASLAERAKLLLQAVEDTQIGKRPVSISLQVIHRRRREVYVGRVTVWEGSEISHSGVHRSVTGERAVQKIERAIAQISR